MRKDKKRYEIKNKAVEVFGERLKQLMKKNKIFNTDLSDNIGISDSMIGYYFNKTVLEGRENPVEATWETTCKIIDYLRSVLGDNIPYDYLFGIEYGRRLIKRIKELEKEIITLKQHKSYLQDRANDLEQISRGLPTPAWQEEHEEIKRKYYNLKRELPKFDDMSLAKNFIKLVSSSERYIRYKEIK